MGYLNENSLARYDGLIKNWVTLKSGTVDGVDPFLNWQKTEVASMVTFYPIPVAPLDPVVNFLFTESSPASGIKSPDNPSTITGVSSITVTRCNTVGVDENDYTIALGNTYYGGILDVATGVMTVTHSLQELTTNNPYAVAAHDGVTTFEYKFTQQNQTTPNADAVCSHFNRTAGYETGVEGWHLSKTRVYFDSATITSGTGFSAWVTQQKNAGTPVVFTYMLRTPLTIQLTPTQIYSLSQPDLYIPRINTVYSDQQSVQVGYPKSPIATASELTNAIVSLGGNI